MNAYAKLILSHLPSGLAWPKDKDSLSYQIANLLAPFYQLIDERIMDVLRSFDPRKARDIGRWEKNLGIVPEAGATQETRRRKVFEQYTGIFAYDSAFLQAEIKAIFGGSPTIKELDLKGCGEAVCGEPMEPEWNHYVIEIFVINLSREAFYRLKRLGQGHYLFMVIASGKRIPIWGKYKP